MLSALNKATPCSFPSRSVPRGAVRMSATTGKANLAIYVDPSPTKEKLDKLGVNRWPTWGCGVSEFPWSYDENESAYILEGEVVVTPEGGSPVEIKAGQFCTFPRGMSCTWKVTKAIKKHYNFH